jgi:hypothetical protein
MFFFPCARQKLIKELPTLVPSDDTIKVGMPVLQTQRERVDSPSSLESSVSSAFSSSVKGRQHHGDRTAEDSVREGSGVVPSTDAQAASAQIKQDLDAIEKSPGEVAFFKLLHAELKKTTYFFERAQQEFSIREERVREGMEIMKRPNAIMVNEKWSLLAKSIYKLYKDLLLLETFAIMTYCSFSKILKKHDKVTGYNTRNAFMANKVNKANFTNYPLVLEMISRCETLYEKVSERLLQEGKDGLYEDERLFINMIHRLNEQVLDNEGVTQENRKEGRRQPVVRISTPATGTESSATSSLRSLVEENDAKRAAQISENQAGDDSDDGEPSKESDAEEPDRKRQRKEK